MKEDLTKVHDSSYGQHGNWTISVDQVVRVNKNMQSQTLSLSSRFHFIHKIKQSQALLSVSSAVIYGIASVIIMLINKAILTRFR